MNRVIKVPQRKRGLTSSGKERNCHPNVQLLVDTYGGKRMVGYEVSMNKFCDIRFFDILFHSVWMTPENKLVDVTKKDEQEILDWWIMNTYFEYRDSKPKEQELKKKILLRIDKELLLSREIPKNGFLHVVSEKEISKFFWKVSFSSDYPLRLDFKALNQAQLSFILAPRIENK